ncbi:glucose-6-phosphate isomerase [Legionella sp. km772]|uniref:glucose-6-phosphate isomerase n=1 Tax=Legionella sp. km772 TaxID=2498111 RepID=UPI000F8DC302|nr:glucose-6-phosphate isomerase [Legionella sp. km772]RUR12746.1 glucose-6-phosphate isomerase [Legionella sp. km772]
MKQLAELNSWIALRNHAESMRLTTLKELYSKNPGRNQNFLFSSPDIKLDLSSQLIEHHTIELLIALAQERKLPEKINNLLKGEKVNVSENRPALHTALRLQNEEAIFVNEQNITPEILKTRHTLFEISKQIRARAWFGYSGKPIVDIVNIGMGGSDLGPKFCINALSEYSDKNLGFHFISDVDPHSFSTTVCGLDPETTLFIISSKSFTTRETLCNYEKAISWLGKDNCLKNHLIAVTANIKYAQQYGIHHILPLWNWVGGRYSACSAINLITSIAIGAECFSQLLLGAHKMDEHFKKTELQKNLPVLLGLIGIWNINFLHINNLLMLAYAKQLEYFIPYIQQLDMESNGKSIDNEGKTLDYSTSPIVWGGLGNQAQHSYYQLLCQGTHKIAVDCITLNAYEDELIHQMYVNKKHILTFGYNNLDRPNEFIGGNTPLNHLSLTHCSPETIGALIALYEHKIFVQSVIWNINPFDQPGIEGAKRFLREANSAIDDRIPV